MPTDINVKRNFFNAGKDKSMSATRGINLLCISERNNFRSIKLTLVSEELVLACYYVQGCNLGIGTQIYDLNSQSHSFATQLCLLVYSLN